MEEVLRFWFGEPGGEPPSEMWFTRSEETDREIRERFGELLERARRGELDDWAETPRGALALVILLDQMSRNVHRDSPEAFAADDRAQRVTLEAVSRGFDRELGIQERAFLYMPMMHSEDPAHHERSIDLFTQLVEDAPDDMKERCRTFLKYAHAHKDVVDRFGRYPHRNRVLGRESTPEEIEHLRDNPGW